MRTTTLILILGTSQLCAALPPRSNPSRSPADCQSAERAKLLEGVTAIPKLGAPGPVAIFGLKAFPVLAASADGKAQMALCAAAGYGKGRAVIFGHTGYLDASGSQCRSASSCWRTPPAGAPRLPAGRSADRRAPWRGGGGAREARVRGQTFQRQVDASGAAGV